jgi:hypothetical protein
MGELHHQAKSTRQTWTIKFFCPLKRPIRMEVVATPKIAGAPPMLRGTLIALLCCLLESQVFGSRLEEAVSLDLNLNNLKLRPFYKGYYGKVGTSTLFIATRKAVPDGARLYWAIVQVLSQKYGCMMYKKINKFPYTSFLCRDGRIVVFHSRYSGEYVVFSGRQFDRKGREIVVKNRRVVARYPIFKRSFLTQKASSSKKQPSVRR